MRHVVPFSRTTNMSFPGLVERPERFSTSCSATVWAIASAEQAKKSHRFQAQVARGFRTLDTVLRRLWSGKVPSSKLCAPATKFRFTASDL